MGDEYLSRVSLEVNGKSIEDFSSFQEGERELHKPVNLMNKTGFTAVTPRYTVTVGYVIPAAGEFDWSEVKDGRLTAHYENGKRVTYTGVYVLSLGEETTDGEKETKRDIKLGASGRIEE